MWKIIEKNKDENYEYEVVHIKDFENQEMLGETRALLAVIYRDYFATDEEREKIKNEEREFYERENKKLENVLNKRSNLENISNKEEQKVTKKRVIKNVIFFISFISIVEYIIDDFLRKSSLNTVA